MMREQILRLLEQKNYVPFSAESLQRHLRVPAEREPEFQRTLQKLERDGEIAQIKGTRYVRASDADLVPGRIRMNRQGVGFLHPDDPKIPEMRVPQDATATAMHGDHVLVRRDTGPQRKGHKPEEVVEQILSLRVF